MKGRLHTEEHKLKVAEALIGQRWWSKGNISKKSKECPGEGWILGRSSIKKDVQ